MIKLAIITGASGAGKTYVLSTFEENNYYVMDNIPISLANSLFKIIKSNPKQYQKVALAIPIYDAEKFFDLALKQKSFDVSFVGLDCSKHVLIERYRLSRRLHPRQPSGVSLSDCIDADKKLLNKLRERFTYYIDTSKMSIPEFRRFLYNNIFSIKESKLSVCFTSFGYKKAVPQDIEMVFDVRVLPNPYWVKKLKDKTGLDKEVVNYIFSFDVTKDFINHLISYLDYYLNQIDITSRKLVNIGIACSGGQHRSVAIAEYLKKHYAKKYNTSTSHREIPN